MLCLMANMKKTILAARSSEEFQGLMPIEVKQQLAA